MNVTGTTAGTLKLAADLATQHVETQLVLAPLAPVFSTMTLVRSNGRIEMRITGFDNTRSLNAANFSFYDRNGTIIGSTLGASVGDAFTRYFGTSTLAGQFALAASFPVQGDIQAITNVDVELINAQGSTRTGKVGF